MEPSILRWLTLPSTSEGADSTQTDPPPLLVDAMLGRLARWLRLMGYDAVYLADADDLVVVRLARVEGRRVLTRDREMAARRAVDATLIDSQTLDEQIDEVLEKIGPPPDDAPPRCAACNTPLEALSRGAAKGRVPPYVWRTQDDFTHCPNCHRVYWKGTHWRRIRARIDDAET